MAKLARSKRIIVIIPVLLLGLLVAGAGFRYVTAKSGFCATCHPMKFYYDSWGASSHPRQASCLSCHSGPGIAGFVDEQLGAVKELKAYFTGYRTPIRATTRVSNRECLACHRDAASLPDGDVTAAHAIHAKNNTLCADCHSRIVHADTAKAESPIVPNAICEQCHKNHGSFVMLVGRHAVVDCADCHKNGDYQNTSPLCETCHQPPAQGHPGLTTGCQNCHSPVGWKPATTIDHAQTGFPLDGGHLKLECAACHGQPAAKPASADCSTCHQPPASHAGISTACDKCHTPLAPAFQATKFVHRRVGEHVTTGEIPLACEACHRSGTFTALQCTGSGCHATDAGGGLGG
jgi:nitrate/TMAO reductase-like tetraheme cytochrome c subunit